MADAQMDPAERLQHFATRLIRIARSTHKEHALSSAQYSVLALLNEKPGSSVVELARREGVAHPTMSRLFGGSGFFRQLGASPETIAFRRASKRSSCLLSIFLSYYDRAAVCGAVERHLVNSAGHLALPIVPIFPPTKKRLVGDKCLRPGKLATLRNARLKVVIVRQRQNPLFHAPDIATGKIAPLV
jgi:hypothetical protein